MQDSDTLQEEADRLLELLQGKEISRLFRSQPTELGIEFKDGTRLFIDQTATGLEFSIT